MPDPFRQPYLYGVRDFDNLANAKRPGVESRSRFSWRLQQRLATMKRA
jgi:hypothetical protein